MAVTTSALKIYTAEVLEKINFHLELMLMINSNKCPQTELQYMYK